MGQWAEYGPGSAVQESVAMNKRLEAQGVKTIYMHQGAEETEPKAFERSYTGRFSGGYNSVMAARENMADFAQAFFGLPADATNTFVIQSNGRDVLGRAWRMASQPFIRMALETQQDIAPAAIMPRLHWPMYQDVAEEANVYHQLPYELKRGGMFVSVLQSLADFEMSERTLDQVSIFASNLPANPTGFTSSRDEMWEIQNLLNSQNSLRDSIGMPKVVHIADDPYFAGLKQKKTGSVFETPYEGNFEKDGVTPSIHVISFSKALGMARPGMTGVVFTNSEMAKQFEARTKAGNAFSYEPEAVSLFSRMIAPGSYPALRDHFENALRAKYVRNFAHVQENLGEHLVDGDPNMVCTIRIPAAALNKSILCNDGQTRGITNGRQVAEYIANTYGPITVDQSLPGEPMLRLALKLEDSGKIEQGTKGVAQGLDDLMNAPALAI